MTNSGAVLVKHPEMPADEGLLRGWETLPLEISGMLSSELSSSRCWAIRCWSSCAWAGAPVSRVPASRAAVARAGTMRMYHPTSADSRGYPADAAQVCARELSRRHGLVHGLGGERGERVVLHLEPEQGRFEIGHALAEEAVLSCQADGHSGVGADRVAE